MQFCKSYRPAFYDIWPKKSNVVGPRCPWRKDPDIDYDVDSDEEVESYEGCPKADEKEMKVEGVLSNICSLKSLQILGFWKQRIDVLHGKPCSTVPSP